MPDTSAKLGIPLPLGNETFSRQAYRQALEQIDESAASQAQADEPFYLRSVTYEAANGRLHLTLGKGRVAFLSTLVSKVEDSSYYINSPAANTDYYLYLKADGTFMHNTTGAEVAGAVQLWKLPVGADLTDPIVPEDRRGQLPGAGARRVQDNLDAHKTAAVLDHPDGSVTDAKIGSRTVTDATAPTGDSGLLGTVLGWFANMLKAITGEANWRTAPATTLKAAKAHFDRTDNPHNTTAAQVGALPTTGGSLSGDISLSGGSSPYRPGIKIGDGTGWRLPFKQFDGDTVAYLTDTGELYLTPSLAKAWHDGNVGSGGSNQAIQQIKPLFVGVDTRSWTPTAWNAYNKPTTIQVKDGATVVGTVSITYNSDDNPTTVQFVGGGKTITWTISWSGTKWTGTTKAVS